MKGVGPIGGGGGAINYCIRVSTTSKIDDLTCVD